MKIETHNQHEYGAPGRMDYTNAKRAFDKAIKNHQTAQQGAIVARKLTTVNALGKKVLNYE